MAGDRTLTKKIGKVNGPCFPFQTQYPQAMKSLPPPSDQENLHETAKGFPGAARIGSPRILRGRKKRSKHHSAVFLRIWPNFVPKHRRLRVITEDRRSTTGRDKGL